MISGILAITIAFVAATVSTAAYWLYHRDNDERFYNLANRAFTVMGVAVVFSIILLYFNIFTHNFQLNYVYSYTSSTLSTFYLISTFWAGQEGTFLLWLLYGTIFGIVLIRSVGRREPLVVFFVMLVQAFLLLILLRKNPFAMIWHEHAQAPVGFTPADGAGLNPLLQNPWMIIHPPIMFVGYSSTVVAFAFAMNAMVKREFHKWVLNARPWVIFSTLALGTGIILGGYWSYVTLGWGGYWAWDPVENASFVPFLFAAVLLHGLIIQSRQKGLVKTNLFLAGLAFISVLWGSFLTRSGVLTDFSVHSFGESGLNLYLIAFVGFFSAIFLYQFFKSVSNVESPKFAEGIFSRETFILLGMMALLFTGITVFIATSSPIYTGIFGHPSNVSIDFYNTISVPIAIFMLATMGIAPLLAWKVSEFREKKTVAISAAVSLAVTLVGIVFGLSQPISIILIFLSTFVIVINGFVSFKFLKKIPSRAGAFLAHVGVAFMIIGIITSSLYDTSEKVTLPAGEFTKTKFGYEIKFVDFVQSQDGKDRVQLLVKREDGTYKADPQFYYSEFTQSYMLSPHVNVGLGKDIYISPISYMPSQSANNKRVELHKNNTATPFDGLRVTFKEFVVGDHTDSGSMTVQADVTVAVAEGDYWKEYSVLPKMWMQNGELKSNEVTVPDAGYRLKIESLDANEGKVTLSVISPVSKVSETKDILAIEVSEKPLISILWFGTIIMIVGMILSLVNRAMAIRKQ